MAILVLLFHVNFSMLIPQVDEVDCADKNGRPIDDINSFTGYIDQVVLGHTHSSPNDEDDDNARYFHQVKMDNYSLQQPIDLDKNPETLLSRTPSFPLFPTQKIPSVFFEVQSPPPKVVVLF